MRIVLALRTFIAAYIIPGLGFAIVGRQKLAIVTVIAVVSIVLGICWTRLVLIPLAYIALVVLVVSIIFWSACHAAAIDFRRQIDSAPRRDWKSVLIFAVATGLPLIVMFSNRATILGYDLFRLPAASMAPTLVRGDHVLVDTWRYRDSDVNSDDVVVFELPNSGGIMYVKRAVGLPGDVVTLESNVLTRNGVPVDEPYTLYDDGAERARSFFSDIQVPNGEYFVLGDNRNNSRDSRYVGTIPKENIIGPAVHLWYSRDEKSGIQWSRFPAYIR